MKNKKIRKALFDTGIKQYMVAEEMGVADETLSRWLRHELPIEKQNEILAVITKLSERK